MSENKDKWNIVDPYENFLGCREIINGSRINFKPDGSIKLTGRALVVRGSNKNAYNKVLRFIETQFILNRNNVLKMTKLST